MKGIGTKMAKGAVWMLLFKFLERSLGLISTIILARLLLPQDFGLVSMAMSIIAVLELLSAFNFDVVLIQNQAAEPRHYNTAWTFNVLFAVVGALLLVALAIPASHFYMEPRLEIVMYCLAFGYLLSGFENIGIVAFRKEMQFNKEFKFLLSKKLIGFFVTVPLAFILQNYWALILGMLTNRFSGLVLSYIVQSYRPWFSLEARHELFHFSKWLLINNVLNFFRFRFIDFIIGRFAGSHALGIYNVAFSISNLPTTEMTAPINRAVLPGYSRISDNLNHLRQSFLNVISVVAVFALPAGVGIAVTAELVVKVFLGDKWLDAIEVIQVLAIFGTVTAMQSNVSAVFLSLKKPEVFTYLALGHLVLLLPFSVTLTIDYGVLGAAWSYLITSTVTLPIFYFVTFKYINLKSPQFFFMMWRPIVAVAVMYSCLHYLLGWMKTSGLEFSPFALFLVAFAVGSLCYAGVLYVLWVLSAKPEGAESFILSKTISRVKSRFSNAG